MTSPAAGRLQPPQCPSCKCGGVGRSFAQSFEDELLGAFSCLPYRCQDCDARFYRYEQLRSNEITIR